MPLAGAMLKLTNECAELERQVRCALVDAGFTAGRYHIGGGWSDWGAPPYEPPIPGYVVEHTFTDDYTQDNWHNLKWVYVDHAGKGRKNALPLYLAALQAAGFEVTLRPKNRYFSRPVVVIEKAVDGRWK